MRNEELQGVSLKDLSDAGRSSFHTIKRSPVQKPKRVGRKICLALLHKEEREANLEMCLPIPERKEE